MIGIVIVSHSEKLAEGVVELARQMGGSEVTIVAAGGTGDPDNPIGTSAERVMQAIDEADSGDGVLVLVDLGSAIMSTEMAIELLDDEQQQRVRITSAPLIEGAIVASTQAKVGSSIEQIIREAREALLPKREQIDDDTSADTVDDDTTDGKWQTLESEVPNALGLHLRPASKLVSLIAEHDAEVRVTNITTGKGPVSGRSTNRLSTLGAQQGHTLRFEAHGPATATLFAAIQAFAADNFGDAATIPDDSAPQTVEQPDDAAYRAGLAASRGIAIAPARRFTVEIPEVSKAQADDATVEETDLTHALDKARGDVDKLIKRIGGEEGAIFEAHKLLLADDALRDPAVSAIRNDGVTAAYAWQQAYEEVAQTYAELESDYQRQRAQDVRDIGVRVLRYLLDDAAPPPQLDEPGILIADDLTPADTAQLDPAKVKGIATAAGAPTSHSAILAQSLGIPAVVGLGALNIDEGTPLIVDGTEGRLYIEPDEETRTNYQQRADEAQKRREAARKASHKPAKTKDGHHVEVFANIGSLADAKAAVEAGAEGVGLFRTEFLFLDRQTAPTADEQEQAYRAVAEALDGRPLIIRTLDVGGDKPLPYIEIGHEDNPFLGWRAIRVSLSQTEMFRDQLRAILRVSADHPVKIMFPMVATVDEFTRARALVAAVANDLGVDLPPVGTMVEIPALALMAEQFATEVDFFSVGTNDLTQYTLAAERGNPRLAQLGDAFQPAVLRLIKRTVEAATAERKWVGVCGALAGHPLAVPLLTGLGITELSMSPSAIAEAKQIIRTLTLSEAQAKAEQALNATNPDAVRALFDG